MNACDVGRERIHALLDLGPGAEPPASLTEHLATCPGCRDLYDELAVLGEALRARPRLELPSEDLEKVWEVTTRASRGRLLGTKRRAAVAAVLVTGVSLATLYLLRTPPAPSGPSAAEVARAEAQADLVLSYAARALDATRTAAAETVVRSKISPAVRGGAPADSRRP